MAEYESSGIWVIGHIGPFRHGMIGHSSLDLPPELSARFDRWITHYLACLEDDYPDTKDGYPELRDYTFDIATFNEEGRELARALKAHVGPECYVEFQPEAENGLGPAEVIEDDAAPNQDAPRKSRYDDVIGIMEGPSDLSGRVSEHFTEALDRKYPPGEKA